MPRREPEDKKGFTVHLSWYEAHDQRPHIFGESKWYPTYHEAARFQRWAAAHHDDWCPDDGYEPTVSDVEAPVELDDLNRQRNINAVRAVLAEAAERLRRNTQTATKEADRG